MNDNKRNPPFGLDMNFDEALERFGQTEPDEMPSKDIVPHKHNGEVIHQRSTDGYINATAMCKAVGKEWSNYRKNDGTEGFLQALEGSLRIRRDLLVQTVSAGPNDQRGTWIHPQVAINLAQWLSPEFAVQVSEWVVTWMMAIAEKQKEYPDFNSLSEDEKRLYLRDQVSASNKQLAAFASKAGVKTAVDFSIFNAKGLHGMYEGRGVKQIQEHKGLPKNAKILDHMGSAELAANLFRITQTGERLVNENVKDKYAANHAHYEVGRMVRQAMIEMSGIPPENLPTAPDVKKLQRQRAKQLKGNDGPKAIEQVETQPTPVDLRKDLWKYALLIMVQKPNMEITTTALIDELPRYISIPDHATKANVSRGDSKFSQLVRNLKSHKYSKTNFIYKGYAQAIHGGFRATEKGRLFLMEYFKDRIV